MNIPSQQELDQLIKTSFLNVRTALDNIEELKLQLGNLPDAFFTQAAGNGFNYTQADITAFKTAINDLDKLREIAYGQTTQATNKNFFADARKVWGLPILSRR